MASRGLSTFRAAAAAAVAGPPRLPSSPSAPVSATARHQRLARGGGPAAAAAAAALPAASIWRAAAGGVASPFAPPARRGSAAPPPRVSALPGRPRQPLCPVGGSPPAPSAACRRCLSAAAAAPPPSSGDPPRGKPFLLADIGEGITTVTLSSWKVAVGDTVAAFDPVSEVASDKASVEITAPWGGVIRGLAVAEGETAHVGKPLCWIDPEGEGGEAAGGNGDHGGGGLVTAIAVPNGGDSGGGGGAPAPAVDAPVAVTAAAAAAGRGRVLAAPAVRARAREAGVDLTRVDGTGPAGRVLAADVARVAAAAAAPPRGSRNGGDGTPPVAAVATAGQREADVMRVPLTPVRSAMVRTMTDAAAIPHLRLVTPVDVTALVGLRRRLNASLAATPPLSAAAAAAATAGDDPPAAAPVKLTYLPFFLRATSMALTAHPALNATFPPPHDAVHVHAGHHISVAVDTPGGLHVPTVRDAAGQPVTALAAEVARLARAAAAGRLGVAEVSGGTVGLSNIGALGGGRPPPAVPADGDGPPPAAGGMIGLPLLLPPQVLIGAVGDIVWEPRLAADGGVARRAVVQVCWAADHRVVEGGAVARYAATWRSLVECPERLLLGE